jgi:hypothetical protein
MNSLTKHAALLARFSTFELSYETVSHKKVCDNDSIAVAIPLGRKYFLWFTYPVCYVLGLDKDKQICSVAEYKEIPEPQGFKLGTIVYCTLVVKDDASKPVYVAEDIYQFRGTVLHNLSFGDRIGFLRDFVQLVPSVALPVMWFVKSGSPLSPAVPADLEKRTEYTNDLRISSSCASLPLGAEFGDTPAFLRNPPSLLASQRESGFSSNAKDNCFWRGFGWLSLKKDNR